MFFGTNVQFLRKKNKLSQKEFGDIFFVSNKAVSKWESGLSVPDIETINKIAEYFKTDMQTICNVDLSVREEQEPTKKRNRITKYIAPICVLSIVAVSLSVILPIAYRKKTIKPIEQNPETEEPVVPDPVPPVPPTPSEETYTIDSIKLVKVTSTPLKINYSVTVTISDKTKTVDYFDLELLSRYSYEKKVDETTEKGSTYVVYSKSNAQKESLGDGKFVISHDVTNLPNNGSWFFPVFYVGTKADDLANSSNPFGNSLVSDVSTYRIMQTDSTNNRPLVTRQQKISDIPSGASFSFKSGEIKLENNRPQVILSGTCINYTFDTLSTQLGYQIKHNGGSNNEYVEFNNLLNSSAVLSVNEGTFSLKYYVDGFDKDSYPYYSRFKTSSKGSMIDFNSTNCPEFSANVGQYIVKDGYKYEILWASGSGAASAYNTFGIKISKVQV